MPDNIDDLIPAGYSPDTIPVEIELPTQLYTELTASLEGVKGAELNKLVVIMLEEVWKDVGHDTAPEWFDRVKGRLSRS